MINVALTGAGSRLAGELIRILVHHPDVKILWMTAPGHENESVTGVHHGLTGDIEATFINHTGPLEDVDVIFQCDNTPGAGRALLRDVEACPQVKIIDLSPDFRDESEGFVYGLSELNRRRIVHDCNRVACPSPLAAAILPALLPLARNLLLRDTIAVNVSGHPTLNTAGVETEVRRALLAAQSSFDSDIHIAFTAASPQALRPVEAQVSTACDVEEELLGELYEKYYDDHNFTFPVKVPAVAAHVVNTNKCLLRLHRDGNRVVIDVAIDAWLKGAAGNAVHMMNLLCGLHERVGLHLKASVV